MQKLHYRCIFWSYVCVWSVSSVASRLLRALSAVLSAVGFSHERKRACVCVCVYLQKESGGWGLAQPPLGRASVLTADKKRERWPQVQRIELHIMETEISRLKSITVLSLIAGGREKGLQKKVQLLMCTFHVLL